MRKLIFILIAILAPAVLFAQTTGEEEAAVVEHVGVEVQIDSTLAGTDIFSLLPEGVTLRQSASIRKAATAQVERNAEKMFSGFRIRLYFDSRRGSRELSESVMRRFNARYPNIQADRSFESPNFKVTAGFFRTRIEADAMLMELKADFPDAFVVREKFKFPTIGKPEAAL